MEQAPKDYDLERGGQTNPATNFSFRDPPDPFTRKRRRDPSQSANPDIVKAHHKHDETSRSALDQAVARSAKRTSTAGLGGSDALTQTAVRLTVGRDHISQSTVQRQKAGPVPEASNRINTEATSTRTAASNLGGASLPSLSAVSSHRAGLSVMQHPEYSAHHLSSMVLPPTVAATPTTTLSALLQAVPNLQSPYVNVASMLGNHSRVVGGSGTNTTLSFFSQPHVGVANSFALPSILQSEQREILVSLLQGQGSSNVRTHHYSQLQDRNAMSLLAGQHQLDPRLLTLAFPSLRFETGMVLPREEYRAVSHSPARSNGKLLVQGEDESKLSPQQVFLRRQIEVFAATEEEASTHARGRNKPISTSQVGIRCRHCSHLPISRRQKGATYFPASLQGIYQAAQNMSTTHLQCGLCTEMPFAIKNEFARLLATKVARPGAGSSYWAESAKKLGLVDTDAGIRFID